MLHWCPSLDSASPDYSTSSTSGLAFTRYCYYQYCTVYGIPKGGRGGVLYCPIIVQ